MGCWTARPLLFLYYFLFIAFVILLHLYIAGVAIPPIAVFSPLYLDFLFLFTMLFVALVRLTHIRRKEPRVCSSATEEVDE